MLAGTAGFILATSILPPESITGELMGVRLEFEAYRMSHEKSPIHLKISLTYLDLCLEAILRGAVFGTSKGYSWN